MTSWFPYVVAATVAYGFVNFIYKISAHYGYSSLRILNFQALTISVISGVVIIFKSPGLNNLNYLLILAAVNSLFFAVGTTLKITSLKFIPVNVAMPMGKLKTVFVMGIGLIFFSDRPSFNQAVGMVLALATVFMLARPSGKKMTAEQKNVHLKGIFLILSAAAAIAISITAGKIASGKVDKMTYIWLSYTLVFIYTYLTKRFIVNSGTVFKGADKRLITLGVVVGVLNLAGYYLILKAWEYGPLSLVQGIFSLSMVITIILAAIIYKEKLTPIKIIAVISAITAALFIKGC
ncbi:MAG: EamA family transporter [Elusimicrobia bacterium]|jgi:drug/metabolite transporter (DMT)-like permease|nr:EamA family transporter [Elusimicrobiota bacterium]